MSNTNLKPIVSTITSCYNMQDYLKIFLEKLPQQTYFQHLEVILNHNEPTQKEITLVKNFQAQYPYKIKHIITKPVAPLGTSWNECIKQSSGELLAIWNIDDLRTENSIELQAQMLLNNLNIDLVYGNYIIVNAFGKIVGKQIKLKNIPEHELTRSMTIGPFFMFRKNLCQKAGYFDEQLKSSTDYDFAIRAALNGKALAIENNLGYYLNEQKGLSTKPNSLQPIEEAVIKLRYAIYDRINYDHLPQATKYNIPNLLQFNKWQPVSQYVPNYEIFINNRKQQWFMTGINHFIKRKNPIIKFGRLIENKIRIIRKKLFKEKTK